MTQHYLVSLIEGVLSTKCSCSLKLFCQVHLIQNNCNCPGNLYGLRTWVEYGFRQCKQELGWTDYRFTNFNEINKWWEVIFSSYLIISLNTQAFLSLNSLYITNFAQDNTEVDWSSHPQWDEGIGWKNVLNNFRLIIQPTLLFWLICPWLDIVPDSSLLLGFHRLILTMNQFPSFLFSG